MRGLEETWRAPYGPLVVVPGIQMSSSMTIRVPAEMSALALSPHILWKASLKCDGLAKPASVEAVVRSIPLDTALPTYAMRAHNR